MKSLLMTAFAKRGTQIRVADALGLPATTVNKWAKGYNLPEHHRWPDLERLLGLEPGSLAAAAGIMQPVDRGDEIEEIRNELQRQGAEIASLAGRVAALADRVLPSEPVSGSGSRTVGSKSRGGRRP